MTSRAAVALGLLGWLAAAARAEPLLDVHGEFGPGPQSATRPFTFDVPTAGARLALSATMKLEDGRAAVRVLAPDGTPLRELTGREFTVQGDVLTADGAPGRFRVFVAPDQAVGSWSVRILEVPWLPGSLIWLVPGGGMMVVAVVAAVGWKRRSGVPWRWLGAGAAIWAAGIALKGLDAYFLALPALKAMREALPRIGVLFLGGAYLGLQSAFYEMGVTLAAALIWRRLARSADRGVAVGVGAGAFEALLLGIGVLAAHATAIAAVGKTGPLLVAMAESAEVTPLVWAVAPVERLIAILCHTSSRALILLGVAARRWRLVAGGFLLFAVLDGIAGAFHATEEIGTFNMWLVEAALAVLAVASIPIIRWCVRRWPR
jgi:hypothetical protein